MDKIQIIYTTPEYAFVMVKVKRQDGKEELMLEEARKELQREEMRPHER